MGLEVKEDFSIAAHCYDQGSSITQKPSINTKRLGEFVAFLSENGVALENSRCEQTLTYTIRNEGLSARVPLDATIPNAFLKSYILRGDGIEIGATNFDERKPMNFELYGAPRVGFAGIRGYVAVTGDNGEELVRRAKEISGLAQEFYYLEGKGLPTRNDLATFLKNRSDEMRSERNTRRDGD